MMQLIPGLLLDPTDGRLWMSYGTYFGFIRLVELDPKTGKRVEGNKALNIAIDCEATDLFIRMDGIIFLEHTEPAAMVQTQHIISLLDVPKK